MAGASGLWLQASGRGASDIRSGRPRLQARGFRLQVRGQVSGQGCSYIRSGGFRLQVRGLQVSGQGLQASGQGARPQVRGLRRQARSFRFQVMGASGQGVQTSGQGPQTQKRRAYCTKTILWQPTSGRIPQSSDLRLSGVAPSSSEKFDCCIRVQTSGLRYLVYVWRAYEHVICRF